MTIENAQLIKAYSDFGSQLQNKRQELSSRLSAQFEQDLREMFGCESNRKLSKRINQMEQFLVRFRGIVGDTGLNKDIQRSLVRTMQIEEIAKQTLARRRFRNRS